MIGRLDLCSPQMALALVRATAVPPLAPLLPLAGSVFWCPAGLGRRRAYRCPISSNGGGGDDDGEKPGRRGKCLGLGSSG